MMASNPPFDWILIAIINKTFSDILLVEGDLRILVRRYLEVGSCPREHCHGEYV